MCNHELWPISVSQPFSFLISSSALAWGKDSYKNTIPIFRLVLQILAIPGYFSYPDLNLTPLAAFLLFCRAQRCTRQKSNKATRRGVRFKSGVILFYHYFFSFLSSGCFVIAVCSSTSIRELVKSWSYCKLIYIYNCCVQVDWMTGLTCLCLFFIHFFLS